MLVDSLDLDLNVDRVQVAWAVAAAEIFLYGVCLVLFGFYVHVLRRGQMTQQRFLTGSTISLFVLSTLHCALVIAGTVTQTTLLHIDLGTEQRVRAGAVLPGLDIAASAVYVTSNVIADMIFVFRCYAIWNFQWKIIIFPIILTFGVAVMGYVNIAMDVTGANASLGPYGTIYLFTIAIAVSLGTTFVLMGLTVGRIWWLSRAAQKVMGGKVPDRYQTACAMILESGALYLVGGLAFLIGTGHLGTFGTPLALRLTLAGPVLAQLVTIAPTIIAVRVGLGYSVENVDSFIVRTPRTRPRTPAPPKRSSLDRVLYIHADALKEEV